MRNAIESLTPGGSSRDRTILGSLLIGAVGVRLWVVTTFNVNWDEFLYLSQVHQHLRGELTHNLQTFHVHFFGWLVSVSTNEVDQIIAGRVVMLILHLLTAWLLYRIAQRLVDSNSALFAMVLYLSVSFVIRHGASFRPDPTAICLVMAALNLLLRSAGSVHYTAFAGLLLAVAAMLTIKVSIFLPTVAVILATPLLERRDTRVESVKRTAVLSLSVAACFTLLYWLHTHSDVQGSRPPMEVLTTSFARVTGAGVLPQLGTLLRTARMDFVYWALLGFGGFLVGRLAWRAAGGARVQWCHIAALALPTCSIVLYRNSFPYFYPFVLAPASVLVALACQWLLAPTPDDARRMLKLLAKACAFAYCGVSLLLHGLYVPVVMPLEHQRTTLQIVHQLFPSPTPYLDRSSMVSSFPQVGFFMSTWGLEAYIERGEPIIQQAIDEKRPPLLISNHPLLDIENTSTMQFFQGLRLLEPDREALRTTYIHHWGPLFVAGSQVGPLASHETVTVTLSISGRYTLEASAPVRIDDSLVEPGDTVDLMSGAHEITSETDTERVTLRWGERLLRPDTAPPARALFLGF